MTRVRAWWDTAVQVFRASRDDDITSVAAGVAFYVLLAVFPALAATVSLVSVFVDPERLDTVLKTYSDVIPAGSASIVTQEIHRLSDTAGSQQQVLAVTPYVGFAMLLWSANRGTKALFRGLNAIFDCSERRGFITFTVISFLFTCGAIVFLVFSLGAILLAPLVLRILGVSGNHAVAFGLLRWVLLLVAVTGVIAPVYRYGPSRTYASWRTILSGSILAALLWIGISVLFSWYVTTFGSFAALYGSLSAAIAFMIWIWLSSIALLIGAELDFTLGRQRHGGYVTR